MTDLFYLLPDQGMIAFNAMGRVTAAFVSVDDAFDYATKNPRTFVRFPNGIQLGSRYAIMDGKPAFQARAEMTRAELAQSRK